MDNRCFSRQEQGTTDLSTELCGGLTQFLAPLVEALDKHMDRRLVRTVTDTVEALLCWRHRAHGLLLSELGAYILSPPQAPAGTKRLSNLLRSTHWTGEQIERFLWAQADTRLDQIEAQGTDAYVAWDESVLEKPESRVVEGLSPVRSSKAGRLMSRKPGYNRPPGPPVFVPGFPWLSLLLLGKEGRGHRRLQRCGGGPHGVSAPPPNGPQKNKCYVWLRRDGEDASYTFGSRLCRHALALDRTHAPRSFCGALAHRLSPWPTGYLLQGSDGEDRAAWKHLRGQRPWGTRMLWDGRKRRSCPVGVLAQMVWLPRRPEPLWLVVARRGHGQSPWYLLTNDHIESADDVWAVVRAYARRWQLELTFRYGKSALALESPRLWTWERRVKLLLLASLAYAFLLSLLDPVWDLLRPILLDRWCHRTGQRSREVSTPLYRLRSALSRLWLATLPLIDAQNSG